MDADPQHMVEIAEGKRWITRTGKGRWKVVALPEPLMQDVDSQVTSQRTISSFLREVDSKDFLFMPLGGGQEIGRSCYLLKLCGEFFVLDCGISVKFGEPWRRYPAIEFLGAIRDRIRGIFITHAHHDHCAALLYLATLLPNVPIYCTPETAQLLEVILGDSISVAAKSLSPEPFLPQQMGNLLRLAPVERGREIELGRVRARFLDAGHVPGSCSVLFESQGEGRVLYTGDLGPGGMRISGEPQPEQADIVICEGTYLNQPLHPPREQEEKRLARVITETVKGGGKVLIPAFAVGRAQEIKEMLEEMRAKKEIPNVPIRLHGLAKGIAEVLQSRTTREGVIEEQEEKILQEEAEDKEPAIIIASSGMLRGGASAYLIQFLGQDPKALCAIVGYQDEEAPGREILDGRVQVACRKESFVLSAHADERGLARYLLSCQPKLVILVHREYEGGKLVESLRAKGIKVSTPMNLQVVKRDGTYGACFARHWGIPQKVSGQFVCMDCGIRMTTLRDFMLHRYNHRMHTTLYFPEEGPVYLSFFVCPEDLQIRLAGLESRLKGVLKRDMRWGGKYYLLLISQKELSQQIQAWLEEDAKRPASARGTIWLRALDLRPATVQYPTATAQTPNLDKIAREEYQKVRNLLGKWGGGMDFPPFRVSSDLILWALNYLENWPPFLVGLGLGKEGVRLVAIVNPKALEGSANLALLRAWLDHVFAHYAQARVRRSLGSEEFNEGFAMWVQHKIGGCTVPPPEERDDNSCWLRGLAMFKVVEAVFGAEEAVRLGLELEESERREMVRRAIEKVGPRWLEQVLVDLSLLKREISPSANGSAEVDGGGR
jgi:Cft2 family RNA processing exonuclease